MRKQLVVFTGAGISACSNIATFRSSGGASTWANHNVDQVSNYNTWKKNFQLVHDFYNGRRQELATVIPNRAHSVVADWQRRYDATVLTQNIDDLFERAGVQKVNHVHGSLTAMRCLACGNHWEIGYRAWDTSVDRCPKCNSVKGVKPNVVFFNEEAPAYMDMFFAFRKLREGDVLVVIGTSGQVVQIGPIARDSKATTILSNLESDKGHSMLVPFLDDQHFDHVIHGPASTTIDNVDALVSRLMV